MGFSFNLPNAIRFPWDKGAAEQDQARQDTAAGVANQQKSEQQVAFDEWAKNY
jgi:hypothetical protein